MQIICAVIFLVAYTVYAASSVKACGTLFNTVTGMDETAAMYLASIIIIGYTFLGGFSAVCWTDFFQGMLMLGALLIAPIFALFMLQGVGIHAVDTPDYFNAFSSWKDIVSGLGWGLGYFGMPHIIIRFMSLESQKSLKKSAKIGITWTVLIVIFAAAVGIIGRLFLGYDEAINGHSLVFITMVRKIFPGVISGLLLSAVLAASMSTADSQLLVSASSVAEDIFKGLLKKDADDKTVMNVSRVTVLLVAVLAYIIAWNPNNTVMGLVSNAWAGLGAAFGPLVVMSLYWKRTNFPGAVAGIVTGALAVIIWDYIPLVGGQTLGKATGLYSLVVGFGLGLIAIIAVSLATKAPSEEMLQEFEDVKANRL